MGIIFPINKKTLKYLCSNTLKLGITHLVWNSIESEAEVRKGGIKARVLMGVYILQTSRHIFSGGSVELTCQLCWLKEEDIYHLVTRCPAFHDIRVATVQRLKQIMVEQCGCDIWSTYFRDWNIILRVLICPGCYASGTRTISFTHSH